MRLIIILLIAGCLQVSAKGYGQKINISGKDIPLEKVFNMIKSQTGYVFFYDYAIFRDAKTVSLDIKQGTIEDVLNACLRGQGMEFKIEDKTISITRKQEVKGTDERRPMVPPADQDVIGMVKSEAGTPLSGATISILKLKKIGITNERGEFTFQKVPNGKYQVEISYIGYEKFMTEIVVSDNTAKIDVALKQALTGLDKVVVIPYGTTTQRLNTGDITTVTSKEIEEQPVSNPLAALEGRVPGLIITQTTGLPGGGFNVQIRGQSSIVNGNDPFYVIDGVPYNSRIPASGGQGLLNSSLMGGNPLNFINPNDIESVEVLKDADATAIYGSRAANGAILITTKKGKMGPMKIDINVNSGVTSLARDIKLLNTQQYLAVRHEAFNNDGVTPGITDYDVNGTWDTTRYTDWSKVFLNNHPVYTNAMASVSGGTVNTQWLVGAGYTRQTSGMPNLVSGTGADQNGSMHFNVNTQSADKRFKLSITGSYLADHNTIGTEDLSEDRFLTAPDAPALFNPDGSLNWAPMAVGQMGTWSNPLAPLYIKYNANTSNLVANTIIDYTLLQGLDFRTSLGYTNTQIDEILVQPTTTTDPASQATSGTASYGETNTHSWILEPQISYRLNLGRGVFTALLGGSVHDNETKVQDYYGSNYANDALLGSVAAAGTLTGSAANSQYKYDAVFSRLNYNWQNKYLINLNARRDGSSRFGPGNQFGNFGSVGAAWIFSEENFIQKAFPFLSFGKLRASYGTTGNDQIGDYRFLNLYSSTSRPYENRQALYPQSLFNPALGWEVDKKLEGGIEFGFLKDRITIQVNIYQNRSGNQLVSTPLSWVTGFNTIQANLPALVQNAGQEFDLHTLNIKTSNFNWSTSFNLSFNRNKLLSFPNLNTSPYQNTLLIGQPISVIRLFHMIGVNDSTGVYQFADFKGNPTYFPNSSTDLTSHVNLSPEFYGGFLNSFSYKGFSMDIMFQFVKQTGGNIFGAFSGLPGTMTNLPVSFLDHWKTIGDKAKYQMVSQDYSGNASFGLIFGQQSDFAYSDASFVRLKNLAISWQIPEVWKQKLHFQNCRIYLNAQNLFTITDYSGIDPESQGMLSPPKKVWAAGFQVTF